MLQVNVYRRALIPRKLLCPKKILVTCLTKPYAKENQSNILSKLYTGHNTLWVKHAANRKAESLRAVLSKLDNTFNNNSIFNTKYTEFCTKWQVLLHFQSPICANNHPYIPKIHSSTSFKFHLPIPPLLVHKFILTIPTNTSFLYTSPIFNFPIFPYYHANNLNQKCFPHLSYLANSGCVKGPGSQDVL